MKKLIGCMLLMGALITTGCNKNDSNASDNNNESTNDNKTYVVISDLHLGDSRSHQQHFGSTVTSMDTTVAFLDYLLKDTTWDELVIAGDLFDEWAIPSAMQTLADANGTILTEQQYVSAIVQANSTVFNKLRQLKDAGHKLVYVVGNHDMQVTAADVESALPGLFEYHGKEGVGLYTPNDLLLVEHGHRYDMFNAPYKGKKGIDNIGDGSILPPGFFIARGGTDKRMAGSTPASFSADMVQGKILEEEAYDLAWKFINMSIPLTDVVTGTDGMTRTYTPDDYKGSTARLFSGINQYDGTYGWTNRCKDNGTLITPSIMEGIMCCEIPTALDAIGAQVLASDKTPARVLVFGHSHNSSFSTTDSLSKGKVIYINTGCWLDAKECHAESNRCFAVITIKDDVCKAALKQFDLEDGQPKVTTKKKDEIKK